MEPTARAATTSRRTPASTQPARVKSGAGGNALPVPNRSKSSCLQRLAIHDRTRFPNSGGLTLHAVARPVDAASFAGRIAAGTRSVSLFLVNDRIPSSDRERDETFAFQAEIEVRSTIPFVPRPDPREVSGDDWDERVADLPLRPLSRVRGRPRGLR